MVASSLFLDFYAKATTNSQLAIKATWLSYISSSQVDSMEKLKEECKKSVKTFFNRH